MFIIEIPYMNLDQIYNSGQVFRWIRYRDGKYAIPVGDRVLKIEQVKQRFIMNCTDQEFYDFWYKYLDLEIDYSHINYKIKQTCMEMAPVATRCSGIHILQQDLFEVIVSFMLATATNIPNIKRMIEQIAMKCGTKHKSSMRENGQLTWYEFPDPYMILDKQRKLDDSFGLKRKERVIQMCEAIVDGWLDLDLLRTMDYPTAREYLMDFEGIGPKVADCICLYGLHLMEAFPVDTHIEQILERDFDCDDVEVFREWYLTSVKGYEGLVQQYLFYNELFPPKPGELVMEEVDKKRKRKRSK